MILPLSVFSGYSLTCKTKNARSKHSSLFFGLIEKSFITLWTGESNAAVDSKSDDAGPNVIKHFTAVILIFSS